ncbi:MAG: hypothetical protein LZF61_08985 [Nitrosomonas sp.]|nr:MAG: hypothetical protein LZF61_08985 [Nitrosomonas sp.]
MIHSINLIKNKRMIESSHQRIKLEFLNQAHTIKIAIELMLEQLHKLMGEILKQVQNWDLANPWHLDDRLFGSASTAGNPIH